MKNLKDFYAIGEPIETEIGLCEFIKVKDYPNFQEDLQMMSFTKQGIIYAYHKMYKMNKDVEYDQLINDIQNLELYEIVHSLPHFFNSYSRVFLKVFPDNENIKNIKKENFEDIRKIILDMNCVKVEEINPNPEIQAAIERSKRVKSQEGEPLTFSDIMSSIVAFNGIPYRELNKMTIYQLYLTFHRIGHFKGYDTSTLFATVSADKVKIESWSKHIDLFEEEKHFVTQEQFKKTTGSALNG